MEGKIVAVLVYETGPTTKTLEDESRRRIERLYPGLPVFSNKDGAPNPVQGSQYECAKSALDTSARSPDDSIAFLCNHSPLLDDALAKEAEAEHFRFFAQYSYGENIPRGLIPDFISKDFVDSAAPVTGDLREFVARSLEKFDVGLFFRLPDLRQYRLDFSTSSPRAARLASDCLRIRPDLKFADMHTFLREHPEVLRPVPSYFEVELTTRCGSKPAFWPSVRPATDIELPLAMAEKLNKEIRDASWPGDATVALGGLGDPLLHPDFTAVARTFLENPNVGRLYVETFGDTLVPEFVRQLENLPGSDKLHVIVRLSTLDRVRYRQIYGTDHLLEALANLEAIEKAPPAFTVYVEMVRMTDVEDEIGRYYDRFEKSPLRIIIQKFNRYVDQLPEKRVSDLTPLHRDFCWRLARDMYVTAEGKIPLCRQDPRADRSGLSLNLRDAGIGTFMDVTMKHHKASVQGSLQGIPMPCASCDEWYTFNG